MSKSLHSPTARLLQSSRLFSLPRPLPPPLLDVEQVGGFSKGSDTATLPYPIRQAIVTPASSHHRGDWGLKRPIPRRTTARSSTPVIRVKAQDTFEHITDFESAADHVLTEAKWRQMGIPLKTRETGSYTQDNTVPRSVYDDDIDVTDPKTASTGFSGYGNTASKKRWKYEGPEIAGMGESEFDEYLTKRLSKRKAEFRAFLLKRMVEKRIADDERHNRDCGLGGIVSAARINQLRIETEQNYDAEEKRLRDAHVREKLSSELTAAICDFLDLPGVNTIGSSSIYATTSSLRNAVNSLTASDLPSTHPGAGLSHLRSNAYMENHPYWGPQMQRTPVKARVVRPRITSRSREQQARLGVGGIVTNDTFSTNHPGRYDSNVHGYNEEGPERLHLDTPRMAASLNENIPGGNKLWVLPESATINNAGRISLHVKNPSKEAIAVKRNDVEQIHEARQASQGGSSYVGRRQVEHGYGLSLPDLRPATAPTIQGFDGELGRRSQKEPMASSEAASRIKELMGGRGISRSPSQKR